MLLKVNFLQPHLYDQDESDLKILCYQEFLKELGFYWNKGFRYTKFAILYTRIFVHRNDLNFVHNFGCFAHKYRCFVHRFSDFIHRNGKIVHNFVTFVLIFKIIVHKSK